MARTAASLRSTARMVAVFPAVNRLARYSDGDAQRVDGGEDLAVRLAAGSVAWATSATGDSGGMYQTIGRVRYSGCSGSATRCRTASSYTGERCAASIQSRGMPCRAAAVPHRRVVRVEEDRQLGG